MTTVTRRSIGRIWIVLLLGSCLLISGCRALAAAIVVGAVTGYVVARAVYDPPPRHYHYRHQYYYHGHWHRHPPRHTEVRVYYYEGTWYECQ